LTSDTTARSRAFVAEHLPAARAAAQRLSDHVTEPEVFAAELRAALEPLADAEYAAAQDIVAPGATGVIGVRQPLLRPFASMIRRSLRGASPTIGLYLADRLARDDAHEVRLLALPALERSLERDPERTWQLIRRIGRRAADWITVDSLAILVAAGILHERYRWAELEQLVYSPHKWERRLIGSTLAQLPHALPRDQRRALVSSPGLMLIESLIGDADEDVQKSLSWALRSWREVDPEGVEALLRQEAHVAAGTDDGHRAWVVRDALTGTPAAPYAAELRDALEGVRRHPGTPSTSRAHEVSVAFAGGGLPTADRLPEPPLSVPGARL
jgi:3-methyladenine DNA glycosylase AlkD